ncbi:hypothetical protein NPIL_462491 [Nephila pilipes]|uniref:Uncharacterized protein n=1 Tax=Nephila pilipes TaxID=299642 RepID=A0A8X6IJK0_NEPPI|nr:hypothetical protein NPIL_462491 [Nephila pilipes]
MFFGPERSLWGELTPLQMIFSPPISTTNTLIPSMPSPSPLRSSVAVGSSPVSSPAPELSDIFLPPSWEKVEASVKEPSLAHLEEDLSWCGPPRGLTIDALRDTSVEDLVASIDGYDGSNRLLFAPSGCPSHRWSTGGIPSHSPVDLPSLSCSLPLHRAVDEGVPPASLEALSPVFSCVSDRANSLSPPLEDTPIPSTQDQSTCT